MLLQLLRQQTNTGTSTPPTAETLIYARTTSRTILISGVTLGSLTPPAPEAGDLWNYSAYTCIQLFTETSNYKIKQHSSELNLDNAVRSRRHKTCLRGNEVVGVTLDIITDQNVLVP